MSVGIVTRVDPTYFYVWAMGFGYAEFKFPKISDKEFQPGEQISFTHTNDPNEIQDTTKCQLHHKQLKLIETKNAWKAEVSIMFAPLDYEHFRRIRQVEPICKGLAFAEDLLFIAYFKKETYEIGTLYKAWIIPTSPEHNSVISNVQTRFAVVKFWKANDSITEKKLKRIVPWAKSIGLNGNELASSSTNIPSHSNLENNADIVPMKNLNSINETTEINDYKQKHNQVMDEKLREFNRASENRRDAFGGCGFQTTSPVDKRPPNPSDEYAATTSIKNIFDMDDAENFEQNNGIKSSQLENSSLQTQPNETDLIFPYKLNYSTNNKGNDAVAIPKSRSETNVITNLETIANHNENMSRDALAVPESGFKTATEITANEDEQEIYTGLVVDFDNQGIVIWSKMHDLIRAPGRELSKRWPVATWVRYRAIFDDQSQENRSRGANQLFGNRCRYTAYEILPSTINREVYEENGRLKLANIVVGPVRMVGTQLMLLQDSFFGSILCAKDVRLNQRIEMNLEIQVYMLFTKEYPELSRWVIYSMRTDIDSGWIELNTPQDIDNAYRESFMKPYELSELTQIPGSFIGKEKRHHDNEQSLVKQQNSLSTVTADVSKRFEEQGSSGKCISSLPTFQGEQYSDDEIHPFVKPKIDSKKDVKKTMELNVRIAPPDHWSGPKQISKNEIADVLGLCIGHKDVIEDSERITNLSVRYSLISTQFGIVQQKSNLPLGVWIRARIIKTFNEQHLVLRSEKIAPPISTRVIPLQPLNNQGIVIRGESGEGIILYANLFRDPELPSFEETKPDETTNIFYNPILGRIYDLNNDLPCIQSPDQCVMAELGARWWGTDGCIWTVLRYHPDSDLRQITLEHSIYPWEVGRTCDDFNTIRVNNIYEADICSIVSNNPANVYDNDDIQILNLAGNLLMEKTLAVDQATTSSGFVSDKRKLDRNVGIHSISTDLCEYSSISTPSSSNVSPFVLVDTSMKIEPHEEVDLPVKEAIIGDDILDSTCFPPDNMHQHFDSTNEQDNLDMGNDNQLSEFIRQCQQQTIGLKKTELSTQNQQLLFMENLPIYNVTQTSLNSSKLHTTIETSKPNIAPTPIAPKQKQLMPDPLADFSLHEYAKKLFDSNANSNHAEINKGTKLAVSSSDDEQERGNHLEENPIEGSSTKTSREIQDTQQRKKNETSFELFEF